MPNISLRYLYRDYANYKNHGEEVFNNAHQLSLEEIEQTIKEHLLDDTWFYASRWQLPDASTALSMTYGHDDELDHAFHEFGSVALTDAPVTQVMDIKGFLAVVGRAGGW